jgi:CBS domain-containing protein
MQNQSSPVDMQNFQLYPAGTIADAIRTIDTGHVQIAFVIDENKRLIGTITDGDIRRALLRGESLETPSFLLMSTQQQ